MSENTLQVIGEGIGVDTLLQVVGGLAQFAPIQHAGLVGELAAIAGRALAREKSRSGLSTEQLLERIAVQGEKNKLMLLEDLARLTTQDDQSTGPLDVPEQ